MNATTAPAAMRAAALQMTRAACHVPEKGRQAAHQTAADLEVLADAMTGVLALTEVCIAIRDRLRDHADPVLRSMSRELAVALAAVQGG